MANLSFKNVPTLRLSPEVYRYNPVPVESQDLPRLSFLVITGVRMDARRISDRGRDIRALLCTFHHL